MIQRRNYTAEFKHNIVNEFLTSQTSQMALERKYGIGAGCISRWMRELNQHIDEAFPGAGKQHATAAQDALLARQLASANEEIAILKKILQMLAQSPKSATQ